MTASAWIKHNGRGIPVAPETMVRVRIRALTRGDAEKRGFVRADGWKRWRHDGSRIDILEYQVG